MEQPAPTTPLRVLVVASPVVAPSTVEPLTAALRAQGLEAHTLVVDDEGAAQLTARSSPDAGSSPPFDDPRPTVLAGHSAAGALLPWFGAQVRDLRAYVLLDAPAPTAGLTRLDLLRRDLPADAVEALRAALAAGRRLPDWRDEDLVGDLPDPAQRRAVLAGLRPRGRAFFESALQVPAGWPEAPVAFLRLSAHAEGSARDAESRGWVVVRRQVGHFAPMVAPARVADDVLEALDRLGVRNAPGVSGRAAVAVDELAVDARGLIPAIVQQHDTGEVLMLAWMSAETLRETLVRGETVFWSRSRGQAWHKGASSGNVQRLVEVVADCDVDALLVRVDQRGPGGEARGVACHTGARTCFHRPVREAR